MSGATNDGTARTAELEQEEYRRVKPYGLRSAERRDTRGTTFREHREDMPLEYRTEYHRDRDRIVWSRAFKRLQHKTQVFPHYVEDHYRRRLTHALEVAQIATTLARALGLNEVATEAIALGHDLGHAPFGHAGEQSLNCQMMAIATKEGLACQALPVFGFDHCVHSVEVVSRVEQDYWAEGNGFHGLNLTFDVRDGILKHTYDRQESPGRPFSTVKQVVKYEAFKQYEPDRGSLEAQCVYFADKVGYLLADLEDGIRQGIFSAGELGQAPFIKAVWKAHERNRRKEKLVFQNVDEFLFYRRKALAALILNCIDTAGKRIDEHQIKAFKDVLACPDRIVYVDDDLKRQWDTFYEEWMRQRLFKDKGVTASTYKAERIVRDLLEAYRQCPDLISPIYRNHTREAYGAFVSDEKVLGLLAARNYIAGMTDPFATNQHARLFMSSEHIRFS
jgi:dGTPase